MLTYKFKSIKDAEKAVGNLSRPSKMPSYAWSISAKRCNTGSKLAKVKGSVCYNCYALKGRYMFNNTQDALERRFTAWDSNRNRWTDAMIYLMHNKQHIVNTGHFRFFDSGDIQGVDMLNDINTVAWASPHIRFWLPTKEYKLIKNYDIDIAPNLVIRVSAPNIDKDFPSWAYSPNNHAYTHISTVYSKDNIDTAKGVICPASKQGNQCGSCRACWDDTVSEVSYIAH
tara:strand:+ start:428 stop:1111 length:684 start_codon:yes stop_codon:yes gene_type:complete